MGELQGIDEQAHRVIDAPFTQLASIFSRAEPVDADIVVKLAGAVMPHSCHAGITLIRGDQRPMTLAASDRLPEDVDALQYGLGQGPCLEASEGHDAVLTGNLLLDGRWPDFARRCVHELGVHSMLSVRLLLSKRDRAALNFYAEDEEAFDELDLGVSSILAPFVAQVVERELHEQDLANLEQALQRSRQIGMAVGILMAQHRATQEQAFDMLRVASHHVNRKLRDVALDVVDTGELPEAPPRRRRGPDTD